MKYSLLSQFRGGLLGAAIAEALGQGYQGRTRYDLRQAPVTMPTTPVSPTQATQPAGSSLARHVAECLIQARGSNWLEHWLEHWSDSSPAKPNRHPGRVAIAALPIALFFHEEAGSLHKHIQQLNQALGGNSESSLSALVIGLAIAQILKSPGQPLTLIPTVLSALESLIPLDQASSTLPQKLRETQALLLQGVSLDIAVTQLLQPREAVPPHTVIPLALYCFLSSPDDWQLSTLRAVRSGYSPELTCTLTGALSGIYNSVTGIPVPWQLSLKIHYESRISPSSNLEKSGATDLDSLAAQLLAVWSGAADPNIFLTVNPVPAIASPRVIRPR